MGKSRYKNNITHLGGDTLKKAIKFKKRRDIDALLNLKKQVRLSSLQTKLSLMIIIIVISSLALSGYIF